MPDGGQVGGEGVGLLRGERGEAETPGRETVEGGVDLACPVQHAEDGGFGAERLRPTRSHSLGPGQLHDVRAGPRAQEVSGSGEEVVDVFGEVPAIRSHA